MKRKFDAAKVPQFIALESVSVASPCHANWDAMMGDERSRFCPSCAKNVYNLSAMTRDEAQLLLQEKEGRLCVRYYVRDDGTMLTQDCPVGVAALKERSPSFALWAGVASLALFAAALLSSSLVTGVQAQPETRSNGTTVPTRTPEPQAPPSDVKMGDVALNPLPATTSSPQPSATCAPALSVELGEISTAAAATPTPKPTTTPKVPPVMGKVAVSRLGRVATKSSPTPTPKVDVPPPMMGAIAVPVPSHSQPPAKSKTAPKNGKSKKH